MPGFFVFDVLFEGEYGGLHPRLIQHRSFRDIMNRHLHGLIRRRVSNPKEESPSLAPSIRVILHNKAQLHLFLLNLLLALIPLYTHKEVPTFEFRGEMEVRVPLPRRLRDFEF